MEMQYLAGRWCWSSRRFFCHTCLAAFTPVPTIHLPCKVYFLTDK
jgi:hypothetical protein